MNKKIAVIIVALVVLIGGAVAAYGFTNAGDNRVSETSTSQPAPSTASELPSVATDTEGAYVDYSPTAIANAKGDTLLFFYAPWCPSCRAIESDILSSGVPADVTVIKVDYDSHQDLRQKYGVTVQTTFVKVDASGEELQKFTPSEDLRLAAVIDALL